MLLRVLSQRGGTAQQALAKAFADVQQQLAGPHLVFVTDARCVGSTFNALGLLERGGTGWKAWNMCARAEAAAGWAGRWCL